MNPGSVRHPETYEDFHVGDRVYCMSWIGLPFRVSRKDDEHRMIFLDGDGPCSVPGGAKVDIDANAIHMISHNQWDQIWYWPDRAGETYKQVADRFIAAHRDNEIVIGYAAGPSPMPNFYYVRKQPELAMSFRLSYGALRGMHQIHAHPVVAINGGGIVVQHDPSIPDDRWLQSGPVIPLRIELAAYRWALLWGRVVLNWSDFERAT